MFRRRLAAASVLASIALTGSLLAPGSASAQEVINLDEEEGGGGDAGGGEAKGDVDIDLDEGAQPQQEAVVAGTMTEGAAAAKKMFDKERWSELPSAAAGGKSSTAADGGKRPPDKGRSGFSPSPKHGRA